MIHKIKALHNEGAGLSIRSIARELGISRNTIRKYLRMDEVGICQDRSRLFDHAARHFSSLLRSGFNATGPTGSQFRVWPDHRAGLAAFACS